MQARAARRARTAGDSTHQREQAGQQQRTHEHATKLREAWMSFLFAGFVVIKLPFVCVSAIFLSVACAFPERFAWRAHSLRYVMLGSDGAGCPTRCVLILIQ